MSSRRLQIALTVIGVIWVNTISAAQACSHQCEPLQEAVMPAEPSDDLWQSCQTDVNGAPLWAMQKMGVGPLDVAWGYAMCNSTTKEIACPRKSGWDTRTPLPCRQPGAT
jgi:hypothetical protein